MAELLAPAGSYDSLRAAVNAGADAVYIGGKQFGARAYAKNPDGETLLRGIDYCHRHGRRIYLTVNTLLKEQELEGALYGMIRPLYAEGLDGVIVQDFGVLRFLRKSFPDLPVHASTQMTVTGPDGARLLKGEGVSRVVPARELSLAEVKTMIQETGLEVEVFAHGALCYSYSGQCLMSSLIGGRSGNRGRCAQPCRLPFHLERPGAGTFLMSMKDLCTLPLLPELLEAGIASLKIEGRMKRPEYTAGVVSVYRRYIDRYESSGMEACQVREEDQRLLLDLYNRGGFSGGYYHSQNGREMMAFTRPNHQGTVAAQTVREKNGTLRTTAVEPLHRGDVLEAPEGKPGFTLCRDVPAGQPVPVPAGTALKKPGALYRTRCEHLLEELRLQYLDREFQERIKGDLRILKGSPAILEVCFLGCGARAQTERPVSPAQSAPLTEDYLRRQMGKTGNTPFAFGELKVTLEEDCFLSAGELNALRRDALTNLAEALVEKKRRTADRCQPALSPQSVKKQPTDRRVPQSSFTVLVTLPGQLAALLERSPAGVDTVYLDPLAAGKSQEPEARALMEAVRSIRGKGWRCYLNFPPVFRERDRMFFGEGLLPALLGELDGCLVHTLDELSFVRGRFPELSIAGDSTLYGYNRRAAAFLEEKGVARRTLPAELNFRELLALGGGEGTELTVYGREPLMQSAQCLVKNTGTCRRQAEVSLLRDRKKAAFPVLNRCDSCCNTVYNSVALNLTGCREEIKRLSPEFLRLSFTVESREETAEILYGFFEGGGVLPGGTRGHFRRGVE